MKKAAIILTFVIRIISRIAADPSEDVLRAYAANFDPEVTRIMQKLALLADFEQLDKIQEWNFLLFSSRYFPGEFITDLIFRYKQTAGRQVKDSLAAGGNLNPFGLGTWRSTAWELEQASKSLELPKDAASHDEISRRIEMDVDALLEILVERDLEDTETVKLALYLGARGIDLRQRLGEDRLSHIDKLITSQGIEVLEYLFRAGTPFPSKLPESLSLADWVKEAQALVAYLQIWPPNQGGESESQAAYDARKKKWTRLWGLFQATEIAVPASLEFGPYCAEDGYFPLAVTMPELKSNEYGRHLEITDISKIQCRYYIEREAASRDGDRWYSSWVATAILKPNSAKILDLKEIIIKDGESTVAEGLWGFSVLPPEEDKGALRVSVANYFRETTLSVNEKMIPGATCASLLLPQGGVITISGSTPRSFTIVQVKVEPPATIKIGAVGPITGTVADFGILTKNAYEMAIAEWNVKGGLFGMQIDLAFVDDKGDPTKGAAAFTKLIQEDKAVAIVGAVQSTVSLAGATICQSKGIPMISPTSTNPKVTAVGDFIFRACFIDPFQGTVGARFAFNELKSRKAAAIFDSDSGYAKGLAAFFMIEYEALGGQVVAFEGHVPGTTDFKAQLAKMLATEPEVLYLSDYYYDVALIAKQARELGFTGPIVGGDGWEAPDLVRIGGTAVENGYFTSHFSKDDPRPIVQDFRAKYMLKFGIAPDAFAALGYDAMTILLDAIKRAGATDGKAIRDALKATDLALVSGRIRFDRARNPIKSAAIITVGSGKLEFLETLDP